MSFEPVSVGPAARWVILGSTGFVGSALVRELESREAPVLRLSAPRLTGPGGLTSAAYVGMLPTFQGEIDELANQLLPGDIVINAAGLAEPDSSATPQLFGANSILPGVLVKAAGQAGVRHFIHLSSAAVQGSVKVLTASPDTRPFSPYSSSKSLGEAVVVGASGRLSVTIVRATSVQGPGRRTTRNLQKLARSPLASVASPGGHPTTVSSIYGLVDFVLGIAPKPGGEVSILLQPWEGGTVSSVLELASGGKRPLVIPAIICTVILEAGRAVSQIMGGRLSGHIRRVELMWFGQSQEAMHARADFERGNGVGLSRALTLDFTTGINQGDQ